MPDEKKLIFDIFKQTELWKHFELTAKDNKENILNVEKLAKDAFNLLDRIVETFPTYTLHNGQHQLNIINRIADLLGNRLQELSDLETAILILGAFCHDIGMVFSEDERQNLKQELLFAGFLEDNPAAILAIANNQELPIDIAEWYCRWSHAKRVWVYLDKKEDLLVYDNVSIKKILGEVCLSHNENTNYLKEDVFGNDYLGKADLRFCSVILRLADILDFDNTRSPESVFEYLKLGNPQSHREKISHIEWAKHLASKGFNFKENNTKTPYELNFIAAPDNPAVENDIREFLDSIELELQRCSVILKFCSIKWQNFILPDKIKRNNIHSQGYKFGNYKFSLDQEQILDLLMGENLYDDHYVFVRELLQNAIDTSRNREFHEHKIGNKDFKVSPIEVSTWIDNDGHRWLRIDDYGMGMTESIINKYFLKVGNSYYNSDEFKVKKLAYHKTDSIDFTPISRFGIGILSCFIAGDLVEVSTRSIECNDKDVFPIRLSLRGLHNFYIMQTDKDIPMSMPEEDKNKKEYRGNFGTSVAVRFKVDTDPLKFDIENVLKKVLFNPPIKVLIKGKGFVCDYSEFIEQSFFNSINEQISISKKDKEEIKNTLKIDIKSNLKLQVIPINLDHTSPQNNLRGKLAILKIRNPKYSFLDKGINENDREDGNEGRISFSFDYNSPFSSYTSLSRFAFYITKTILGDDKNYRINITEQIEKKIPIFGSEIINNHPHNNLIISHNGIGVPNSGGNFFEKALSSIDIESEKIKDFTTFYFGIIELIDDLRPRLSISRNKITSINWKLWSQINYSIYTALNRAEFRKMETFKYDFLTLNNVKISDITHADLIEDVLVKDINFWGSEKIFNTRGKTISIKEIVDSNAECQILSIGFYGDIYLSTLQKILLQNHCSLKIKLSKYKKNEELILKKLYAKNKVNENLDENINFFPPLTFVRYENFKGLISGDLDDKFLNIDHLYSNWLIKSANILFNKYSAHYWSLLRAKDLSIVNETLQKLRKILPEKFKPPKDLVLTKKDFEVDSSILELDPNLD